MPDDRKRFADGAGSVHRRVLGRVLGWVARALAVAAVVVGVLLAAGQWSEDSTRPGADAPAGTVSAGAGTGQPRVPDAPSR